jgi:hypothetical protein
MAQFPPPAGQPGSTAIYMDSTIFTEWAAACTVYLGYIDIADTTIYYQGSNRANYGTPADATGKADDAAISLGDAGWADVTFDKPITNGPGFDFAVFENGFSDTFLELGFVEVSSDGIRYVRFPSVSLTQDTVQTPTFGETDATKINDLAGKYRAEYGTPFDLDELKDSTGINLNSITHVRIIDVVGCIQPPYSTYDSQDHIINDPFPTPFNSGGFDLDAVGVIHFTTSVEDQSMPDPVTIFPNPCSTRLNILLSLKSADLIILDPTGKILVRNRLSPGTSLVDLSGLPPGFYLVRTVFDDGTVVNRKIIKK